MARHGSRRTRRVSRAERQKILVRARNAAIARRQAVIRHNESRRIAATSKGFRSNVSLATLRSRLRRGGRGQNVIRSNIAFRESGGSQQAFQSILNRQRLNRRISQRRSRGISVQATREQSTQESRARKATSFRQFEIQSQPSRTQPTQVLTSQASIPLAQEQQGFRGDVGLVGTPTIRGLPSDSKFEIVGGKAVPKGAVAKGGNIAISGLQTTSKVTGQPLPIKVQNVFAQQRASTVRVQQDFVSKRNVAIASGATIKEANALAKSQALGLPRTDMEAITIATQKAIIERKAGQIALAKELIKTQTTEGTTGQLNDLAGALDTAEPLPATQIKLSVDSDGFDINPRRTKAMLNNALLTGNSPDDIEFTIHQDPTVKGVDRGGIYSIVNGEVVQDDDRLLEKLNPRSIDRILGSEQDVLTAVLRDVSLNKSGSERLLDAQKGLVTLSQEEISELTLEGETLKQKDVFEGFANKILEGEGFVTENPDGTFTFTDADGNEIDITSKEFQKILKEMAQIININEDLSAENLELLAFIEELQALLRGGESTSDLLNSLFSLIAELQAQLGGRQRPVEDEFIDPFEGIANFFGDIYLGILSIFGVRT